MATEISYGGYVFPHPIPFVGMSEEPVFLSGQLDHGRMSLSLIGELTGCNLTSLKIQKDNLIAAMSSGYKQLTVGNTGYSYAKPLGVDFAESNLTKRLPYSVDFEVYHQKDFSQFYGIDSPEDIWEFNEQGDRIIGATHSVSARGLKVSATDSLVAARNFVNSRLNGYNPLSLFFTGTSYILTSKDESINRISNSYGITEQYQISDSRYGYDATGRLIRSEVQSSYNGDDSLSVSVRGTIEGGISGSVDTGMFTPDMATELAKNAVARAKIPFEESLYGEIFRGPNSYNYSVDTGSNSISFSFDFNDPTDPRNQDVIHDYTVGVSASKDSANVSVALNGEVRYNSIKDIFTGQAPEEEVRFQKVQEVYSGINHFAIAQNSFGWVQPLPLPYSDKDLNPQFEQFNVNKQPFTSSIDYSYTFTNSVDFFSGLLRNASVTIETQHPFTKYSVKPTTDNSFAVQPLYDTLTRKTVNINGIISQGVSIDDAVTFVTGWAEQYKSDGLLIEHTLDTGSNTISLSKSYVIE